MSEKDSIKLRLTKIGFNNDRAYELSTAYIFSKLKNEDIKNVKNMTKNMINEWRSILNTKINSIIEDLKKYIKDKDNRLSFKNNEFIASTIINKINEIFNTELYYTKNEFFKSIILDTEKNMKNNLSKENLENWINNSNKKNEYIANYINLIKNEINKYLVNIEHSVCSLANNSIYNLEKRFKEILSIVTYEYI